MKFQHFILGLLLLAPLLSCLTQISLKIQTKDSPQIHERNISSGEYYCRADSSPNNWLILFDRNPNRCDKKGYIQIAAPEGEFLQKKRYENFTGNKKNADKPFLYYYYTEPGGIRYHCFDDLQTGWFEITELKFNREGEVQQIAFTFEIHCIVNGQVEKRASTGSFRHSETSSKLEMTSMTPAVTAVKFLEDTE